MSDSVVFSRRDFLKLVGIGVAGTSAGCAQPADKLIPYLVAPEDILPGVPYWYATTCLECPTGCGIRVKTREGRAIKIEGNPDHPVNRGGMCARGQAGLQGLYDPDRVASPLLRSGSEWKKVTWDEALKAASDKLVAAKSGGRGVALVTGHETGSIEKLTGQWAAAVGGTRLVYEPFGHQALREANRRTFGQAVVPNYDFARARHLVSFGADFLETWVSPVGHARGFAEMRKSHEARFVSVEPRLSLTGANADEWIAIRPGGEMALALGMVNVILAENLGAGPGAGLADLVSAYPPEVVAQQTDVPAETVKRMAREFAQARPSLAVAGGIAAQSEQSVAAIAAVNLLNYVAGNIGETVRFDRTMNYDGVASHAELQSLAKRMNDGGVEVLVVHGANPVYSTPAWSGFAEAMAKVPFKISISGVLDETTEKCDLILPATHALESLGDAETMRGVWSIVQPTMRKLPMFDARPAGDILIALAAGAGAGGGFPATWTDYVKAQWQPRNPGGDFESFWNATLARGGMWEDVSGAGVSWSGTPAFAAPAFQGAGDLHLVMYPTIQHYDGRGANKSWLQELPDPTSKAVWGTWVEIHPETASRLGVRDGDSVKVETDAGSVELPAYVYAGIRKDTIAIPLGQGHTAYGRYAKGRGANAVQLLPPGEDAASGVVAYLGARARVSKGVKPVQLAITQPNKSQADREVARVITVAALMAGTAGAAGGAGHGAAAGGHGAAAGAAAGGAHHEAHPSQTRPGKHTEPRIKAEGEVTPAHAATAFETEHHVRSARQIPVSEGSYAHAKHRWAMSIDLDRCTGCAACVVACSAENNIPTVGPDLVMRGRDMAWLRIERFEEKIEPGKTDVRFLPMLCQHCTDAPCETVCPVYATYHNPEGLNAQVYNRCVGTRYCSNNCPYKVRAFNFFDYSAPEKDTYAFPEPLNWQLNPDVTVRSKGVMEKCTFCVQRILEGKGDARDENRALRDHDIQTACQQSCPTTAIVFGDLMDPESEVSRLSKGERRYWVLGDLNTKPGITYLKKVERATSGEPQHG